MSDVIFKNCSVYEVAQLTKLLRHAISELKIDLRSDVSGRKVLIKPNLLGAHLPETAITTHPIFLEAIILLLKDYDCAELWLGDSPNGMQKSIDEVWRKTGVGELCRRYGVILKAFEKEGAKFLGDIVVARPVLEADYIINVPKFKTHGLTVFTCAVKNMFGVVPGLKKTDYHRIAGSREEFAEYLVRIAEVRPPNLNIVDGIVAMAGNGPSGGFPINLGLVAISENMHELDLSLARLINVDPASIDTIDAAVRLGKLDISAAAAPIGDDRESFDISKFKLPVSYTSNLRNFWWFRHLISFAVNLVHVRPFVIKKNCIKCAMCKGICPASAITMDDYPVIDHKKCIECYCCNEVCPEHAMDLKESLLLKVVKAFTSMRR